jgi:hypothetical protein
MKPEALKAILRRYNPCRILIRARGDSRPHRLYNSFGS